MLRCESASAAARDIEELGVFVNQLAALGVRARIDTRGIPADLARNVQFDLAPFLSGDMPAQGETVLVTAAQRAGEDTLAGLRRFAGTTLAVHACGAFRDRQGLIAARARIGYVLGTEPAMLDLADPVNPGRDIGCPVIGVAPAPPPPSRGSERSPRLMIVGPDLADPGEARDLRDLALSPGFETVVLTDGRRKQEWRDTRGPDVRIYHYGEAPPTELAALADICVLREPPNGNYRLRCLIANLARAGVPLLDATENHVLAASEPAFVRAPARIPALRAFISEAVLPRRAALGEAMLASALARQADPAPLLAFLGLGPAEDEAPEEPPRLVFMPTNGVGLGHAQRCGLIAAEMPSRTAVFAAFPSCLGLVKSYGLDAMPLIGRSALHAIGHENDLVNYLRLRALTRGGGTLVFDGGYVFDSVYRAVLGNGLRGVWIRRGLWQSGQDNSVALDREKVFERVIVPGEAFEELNTAYSQGAHLRHVGPIVRPRPPDPEARAALRARLAERFGRPFDKLVVSLLGGGVAADRGAEIQALCGMIERRADTLHLIVVWPTGVTQPVWFTWRNSRVVRTHRAGVIGWAADLMVAAAGYNTFHEALYNGIPTIFVPQTAAFMDDQRARARAARARGVAGLVEPRALMALEREVGLMLDEGKGDEIRARLAALDMPAPGASEAARLIGEVVDG